MPWWGEIDPSVLEAYVTHSVPSDGSVPIAERKVGTSFSVDSDASPGRRLRVFAQLVHWTAGGISAKGNGSLLEGDAAQGQTYGSLLAVVEADARMRSLFESFPLIDPAESQWASSEAFYTSIPAHYSPGTRDPSLHPSLQDLANEINEDVREALGALDDPEIWYPGVDDGIDPVPDEHVDLVIWALQRELNRELRNRQGQNTGDKLPPAPLDRLPRRVQRALAERRRLRFAQYGIQREQQERGTWSLWDVREDIDWRPRRALRLTGQ